MMILFILNFILLLIGFILIYKAKSIQTQRIDQINKIQQQIDKKTSLLAELQKQKDIFQLLAQDKKKTLKVLQEQQDKTKKELKQKQDNLDKQFECLKQQSQQAFENYHDILECSYSLEEDSINKKIKKIQKEREQVENKLIQIKDVYQAAVAARLRQQEDQDKKRFYQIQISNKQIADIKKLEDWKNSLYEPTIVAKIIWSSYIMKPTTDMCNRVLGSSPVCGIYKITNNKSGEIYIGQSVDIATRWKNHIKCGLGIDASSTNKLYNNMQEYGVWDFSFEVLQKCTRDKLNEKERFWIEMYQSNKIGMNITKGNG